LLLALGDPERRLSQIAVEVICRRLVDSARLVARYFAQLDGMAPNNVV